MYFPLSTAVCTSEPLEFIKLNLIKFHLNVVYVTSCKFRQSFLVKFEKTIPLKTLFILRCCKVEFLIAKIKRRTEDKSKLGKKIITWICGPDLTINSKHKKKPYEIVLWSPGRWFGWCTKCQIWWLCTWVTLSYLSNLITKSDLQANIKLKNFFFTVIKLAK